MSDFTKACDVDASMVEWTETILDWFTHAAPNSLDGQTVVVDGTASKRTGPKAEFNKKLREIAAPVIPPRRAGERMVDLSHTRLLSYEQWWWRGKAGKRSEGWKDAYADTERPETLLVLESEAGKKNSPDLNTHKVMEDASKLVPFASRAKVVVFCSNNKKERDNIREISRLLERADYTLTRGSAVPGIDWRTVSDRERPTWLWLDLPWKARPWTPRGWTIHNGTVTDL